MLLDEILSKNNFKGCSEDTIKFIVESNDKKRFTLTKEGDKLWIKANQGHSVPVEVEMTDITLDNAPKIVLHGAYCKSLDVIKKEGLCRMTRQHIHFAVGLPGENGVISGMRSSCQVIIYLDIQSAIKDGITFLKSDNDVILSPGIGDRGLIPPKYFSKIVDAKTGRSL